MLSRWFKRKSTDKPVDSTTTTPAKPTKVAEVAQHAPKPKEPGIVEQLTGGQPIESFNDLDVLHQLLKQSDKLDKRTNRLVRERINSLREQEKARHEQRQRQEKICTRLETLAKLQYHPLFDSELAHVQLQWRQVGQQDTDIAARIETALQQCLQIQQEAHLQKQQAEQEELRRQEANEAARLLAEKRALENAAQAEQRHEQEQTEAAVKKARQLSAAEAQKAIEQLTKTADQQLIQLEEAIGQSNGKKARQLLDRLRETLKPLDHSRAQRYEGKLHLLQGQLRELQDWQDYAALPKLEELCVAMEKLASTELPAPQKADAVRELQNQWRAIKAPGSKNAQTLWDRFKKAGDIAWEPCAIHFDKEKQLRSFNLQQRNAICEALEHFHSGQDWDKADWKAVSRILEKAKTEFHDFHPVERSDEKPVKQRFDAALAAIQAKLLAEQQANESRKQQLIDTAASLNTMADVEKAIERVRQLQEQWKTIGLTRRHVDQSLWQQFQEQCNALFTKRKEAQQQHWQAQTAQMDHAKALCEAIHTLAKLPDSELAGSQHEFDNLQTQFKAITDIPEKSQGWIKKQFHEACDHYRNQLQGISKRQREHQWQLLAQQAALCATLEQTATAAKLSELASQWQPEALPAEWQSALQTRWESACALAEGRLTPAEQETLWRENEKIRRTLLIELEILLDVDTPEEDRQQRREYQIQRLAQGIGQTGAARSNTRERLLAQWHCCGSAAATVQASLDARFHALPVR